MPELPSHIRICFGQLTRLPEKDWTQSIVVSVVARLRKSEIHKDRCGVELIKFYDSVTQIYSH